MHYCVKCLGSSCKGCCKCMGECCKSCDKCCAQWSKCFDRPFSNCLLIQFFIMFCPFALCWGIGFAMITTDCKSPIQVHVIVQGFLLLCNFLIIVYLMYKFSSPQPALENKTYSQKLVHLICYDIVICVYVILLAFEIAWNIVGHVWLNDADCEKSELPAIDIVGIIIIWVYLGLMCLFVSVVAVINCCEQDCQGCLTFWYYCCCCCLCFNKPAERQAERRQSRNAGLMGGVLRMIGFKNPRAQGDVALPPVNADPAQNRREANNPPPQHPQMQYPPQYPGANYPAQYPPANYPPQYPPQYPPIHYPPPPPPPYNY